MQAFPSAIATYLRPLPGTSPANARELELGVHADHVLEDVASAEASGARPTPTFFVCGRRHVGPHDAATLGATLEACRPCPADSPV